MVRTMADGTTSRWQLALVLCATWSCYLPLGFKYATVLPAVLVAATLLWRRRRAGPSWQATGLLPAAALWGLLALSSAWSAAPTASIVSHLGLYALLLLLPLVGWACPPEAARLALRHFVMASTAVGVLVCASALGLVPESPLWRSTLQAQGNQRIVNSVLLALAAGLALCHGWQAGGASRARWWAAASLCALGLALQDRRSGMLLLPMLLLAWTFASQRGSWQRLGLVAAILLAALTVGHWVDGVRGRFAEGLLELTRYVPDDRVTTSWGQRVRMWELTGKMIIERPLLGHGVASWQGLWRERVTPQTPLAANSTPHSEYLLIAQQAGALGAAAWLWLLLAQLRHAIACGPAGVPMLMVWIAIAWSGMFNVVLRDAKFSLPLLLLAALGLAASRRPTD